MSGYTPGPWRVSHPSEVCVIGPDRTLVANTDCDPSMPYDEWYELQAANARLIAGCPEMLIALKSWVAAFEGRADYPVHATRRLIEKLDGEIGAGVPPDGAPSTLSHAHDGEAE